MKTIQLLCLMSLAWSPCWKSNAQNYDTNNVSVQTFAGSGFYGYYDGQGVLTMFSSPTAIAADSSGNLFVYDSNNSRIRKITPGGTVTTFAGGGNGGMPAFGTNATLPSGYGYGVMTIDGSNTLWLGVGNYLIRISPAAYVAPQNSSIYSLGGLCADAGNNIYYSSEHRIFRYNQYTGQTEVFAGSGNQGSIDGNWIFTSFNGPTALAADAANNIYVWDSGNRLIRRINQNRDVESIAGTNSQQYCYYCDTDGIGNQAQISYVNAMWMDNAGNLLLACGSSVRKMTASTNVTTLAGSFTQTGYTNGIGSAARFINARGICASQGSVFVTDSGDHRIRKITLNSSAQIVPETDLGLRMLPSLRIAGEVGRTYRIESSTNLTNWNSEAIVLLTSSPYLWLDESALGQNKFYRAFLLP